MDFLLDANMPRSALRVLADANHRAWHVRDIGLGDATDECIDRHAQAQGWILVTRDLDFCDIRNYPPEQTPGRLVLRVDDTSTAEEIAQLLQRFLILPELVGRIPGHLAILDPKRVRFRPALNHLS
jgi:predicted nuclease of predicted toxin-antitoxin system